MQVSVSDTGGLGKRLEVAVPATEVASEIAQRLKRLSRTARLKGFRPGKAPLAVITKQFGDQVRAEVVNDLMRSTFAQAVNEQNLKPAGGPRIEPIDVALARATVPLSPRSTAGMAIGAQVAQAKPASILAAFMRAEVLRGVNDTKAPGGSGHGIRPAGWSRCGMVGLMVTGRARRTRSPYRRGAPRPARA